MDKQPPTEKALKTSPDTVGKDGYVYKSVSKGKGKGYGWRRKPVQGGFTMPGEKQRCKQRKLTAWNMYQREVYREMEKEHGKEAAFKKTAERLKTAESKAIYAKKEKKQELQKLADLENRIVRKCPKSRKTGFVRNPETGRKLNITTLTAEQAAELRVYKKTNKDGKVRWLYGVDKSGKKHYLGGKKDGERFADDMRNMVDVKRVMWSSKSPQEMRRKGRKAKTTTRKRRPIKTEKGVIKARAMKRTNDLVKKLSQPRIKKE